MLPWRCVTSDGPGVPVERRPWKAGCPDCAGSPQEACAQQEPPPGPRPPSFGPGHCPTAGPRRCAASLGEQGQMHLPQCLPLRSVYSEDLNVVRVLALSSEETSLSRDVCCTTIFILCPHAQEPQSGNQWQFWLKWNMYCDLNWDCNIICNQNKLCRVWP